MHVTESHMTRDTQCHSYQSSIIEDDLPSFEEHQWLMASGFPNDGTDGTAPASERDSILPPPSYSELGGERPSISTSATSCTSNFMNMWETAFNALPHEENSKIISIEIRLRPDCGTAGQVVARKRYTNGEYVLGQVTVTNNSNSPIPFHSFKVSLEGVSKVGSKHVTFLQMVDARASRFKGGYVKDVHEDGTLMEDGTIYGFAEDQTLWPGITYKKYFAFRFPEHLVHSISSYSGSTDAHMALPPTFGFPLPEEVEINPALGYGRLPGQVRAFKFRDMAPDGLSVSYTISARIFGKPENSKKQYLLSKSDYFLQFIPSQSQKTNFQEDSWLRFETLEMSIKRQFTTVQEKFMLWKLGTMDLKEINSLDYSEDKKQAQFSGYTHTPLVTPEYNKNIQAALIPNKKLFGSSKPASSVLAIRPKVSFLRLKYNPGNFTIQSNKPKDLHTGPIPFQLEFTTSNCTPPQIGRVSTRLLILSSETEQAACMDFDTWFATMSREKLGKITRTFEEYSKALRSVSSEGKKISEEFHTALMPEKYLLHACESFKTLQFYTHPLPLYKTKNVPVEWEKLNNTFHGTCQIPALEEHIEKLHSQLIGLNLMPSFQTFLISRSYALEATFKMAGYKNKETLLIPLDFVSN